MEKILEVKNLKISFRTANGTVKAVRNISFDLERGRTLAIVGESGSGKSVTSRAILGILAGNAIVEGGEILYDGRDLLKIKEDEMHSIRGDKISMIFQDPLSSLNPIVKIGKQITEAMLLKNKANRREARRDFNSLLALLRENMQAACPELPPERIAEFTSTFDRFNIEADKYENSFNTAATKAADLTSEIDDFLFKYEKRQKVDFRFILSQCFSKLREIRDPFLTHAYDTRIFAAISEAERIKKADHERLPELTVEYLRKLESLLGEINAQEKPNFFRVGYYLLKNPGAVVTSMPVPELNAMALEYLDKNFMLEFLDYERRAVEYSYKNALEKKKALLPDFAAAKEYFASAHSRAEALHYARALADKVEDSIDRLEITKDNVAYTFRSAIETAIIRYFSCERSNPKEEKRYARQSARRERLIARGKKIDWKVIPKSVYDLDDLREDIISVISRLERKYTEYIAASENIDFAARAVGVVDFMKEKASQVVYRVTRRMAKEKAIKLMEEVGIHEPRRRFNQYPFEFSGGMRQRIVIAIALVANPDVLICDEPTTALDVTIQAQILELINKLKSERRLSVIFITHDLGVVANMADDIAVMYAGKIVEYGTADDIFYDPRHPYTWALLSSMPDLDTQDKLDTIPGTPPNMIYPPKGDAFAERNKYALKVDFEYQPPMFRVSDTHYAATWLLHPDAPKVGVPEVITDRIARMKKKEAEKGGQSHE